MNNSPTQYLGVMISSTFVDLVRHRAVLIDALQKQEIFPIGMENYVVSPEDDLISSSLKMVRKSSGYIGLISHRYGQIIADPICNPNGLSVTQLEFDEANSLGLPVIIFVMGDEHPVKKFDIEVDSKKIEKLNKFKDDAKHGRIYVTFESLEDFNSKVVHAVASLRGYLESLKKKS